MVIVGVCKQRSKNFIESYTSMHRGIIHLAVTMLQLFRRLLDSSKMSSLGLV